MAPLLNNEFLKNSKMIVKRLWNEFKASEEYIKKDTENDLVFDSIPEDKNKHAESSGQQPDQPNNTCNRETTSKNVQSGLGTDEEIVMDEIFSEKEEEEKIKETRRTNKGTKDKKSWGCPTQITNTANDNQGNVNIVNSNKGIVHIGNKTTQTNIIQQNNNAGVNKKETEFKTRVKRTPEIEAVLQSTEKLETGHIEFLSHHFGKSCRDIGIALGISSGLINKIEIDCEKDSKKMSFEILTLWMRSKGKKATIRRVCGKLWNSKIPHAMEAVKQLSENIDNFC